jgi:hypothetical protein
MGSTKRRKILEEFNGVAVLSLDADTRLWIAEQYYNSYKQSCEKYEMKLVGTFSKYITDKTSVANPKELVVEIQNRIERYNAYEHIYRKRFQNVQDAAKKVYDSINKIIDDTSKQVSSPSLTGISQDPNLELVPMHVPSKFRPQVIDVLHNLCIERLMVMREYILDTIPLADKNEVLKLQIEERKRIAILVNEELSKH